MSARDKMQKLANKANVNPEFVMGMFDTIIEAVREEVCTDKLKWETPKTVPELIQGYTAEQWQETIDGGYLCEFSNNLAYDYDFGISCGLISRTETRDGVVIFKRIGGPQFWDYCRPAQLKGVMRPIWVEPVDPAMAGCVFFNEVGYPLHAGTVEGYKYNMDNNNFPTATKYIEL